MTGSVCRLRDVHDLLMDTGLGAKAYAIIEQGKIGMILSTRPTDRRQLIEEAAGVTKYKARRRAAELKLEAAQQNLTRIDDIVFEVEKQRGTLKRQAAKARRYQQLRDELRRWEKVLFARKYRQLAETIESARARLADARERESVAAARVGEVEADLGRLRIELVEAESRATAAREAAHARELAINRRQQQIAFDREQIGALDARAAAVAAELDGLEARREPARIALAARRDAAADANGERVDAGRRAGGGVRRLRSGPSRDRRARSRRRGRAQRSLLGDQFGDGAAPRDRARRRGARPRRRDAVEAAKRDRTTRESSRSAPVPTARQRPTGLRRAHEAIEATRIARAARESELASARIEHEWRARSVRAREHELAGLEARLTSLEELEAARAGYGDAARTVLVAGQRQRQPAGCGRRLPRSRGRVRARGRGVPRRSAPARRRRDGRSTRPPASSWCARPVRAAAGSWSRRLPKRRSPPASSARMSATGDAGVASHASSGVATASLPDGVVAMSSVVRVNGPLCGDDSRSHWRGRHRPVVRRGFDRDPPDAARSRHARGRRVPRSPSGVGRQHRRARGILETKREIKELRDRAAADREALMRLAAETAELDSVIAHAVNAIAALNAEHHKQEKAVVGLDAQQQHAADEQARLAQKAEQLAREKRQAEEERDTLDRRQDEARASIARLESAQREADERLTVSQRRLFEARESPSRRSASARPTPAPRTPRSSSAPAPSNQKSCAWKRPLRSSNSALPRSRPSSSRRGAASRNCARRSPPAKCSSTPTSRRSTDCGRTVALPTTRWRRCAARADEHETAIKAARAALDAIRAIVSELDVARATAEADLSHLAHTCEDAVNAPLDQVIAEIDQLEREGRATPDAVVVAADDGDEDDGESTPTDLTVPDAAVLAAEQHALSAEEAIAALRGKIDRLGPVNMMAIEQFDELESRHAFLTTQRKDLVDSIAQTSEAIKRIDETTRQRFAEAFAAINRNFQQTFSTLFGGGRAGLTLLDENDPLESGIEIIAQPPGKRLQSVQLLSGGEKALTAIALMFGMFKYKPSPFCLLDEIDAPLDDANIGRFVEMLRGMQDQTQFIIITHSRKTMEIADRLYGVTMEEPGVSKLISVQLN